MLQTVVSVRHANQKTAILDHELSPSACLHMQEEALKDVPNDSSETLGAVRSESGRKQGRCDKVARLLRHGWIGHTMRVQRPVHQSQPNFNNGLPHFGQGVRSFAS